jgi:hypothetical protein
MKRWMALGLLACACGSESSNPTPDAGTPTGSGNVTGSVNGATLTVRDAVFGITPGSQNVNVVAGDRTGLCTLLTGTTIPGPTTVFGFGLLNLSTPTTPAPVVVGDYAYFSLFHLTTLPGAGKWWDGAFAVATNCSPTGSFATGGTVSVTQVGTTTTNLKVTLNGLTFPDGGTLGGNIEAVYCSALQTQNPPCGGISLLARPPGNE